MNGSLPGLPFVLLDAFYLELLYLVFLVVAVDENRHEIGLSAGVEVAERIFHVGPACRVGHLEGSRSVRIEEVAYYLTCLHLARIPSFGEDGDVEVVGKPGGKRIYIALRDVLRYRYENIVIPVLGLGCGCRAKHHKRYDENFES